MYKPGMTRVTRVATSFAGRESMRESKKSREPSFPFKGKAGMGMGQQRRDDVTIVTIVPD